MVRVFIAGIMQGSKTEKSLHSQDYRKEITELLTDHLPGASVYDPFEKNQNSLNYAQETGRDTFLRHNKQCGSEVDLLIAFVPEASMGTAIEMWEAWKNGAVVISISPMARNWAVRFLSHKVYPTLEDFREGVKNGDLDPKNFPDLLHSGGTR